ncbi:hypothetical protein AgCh_017498 [Apium graveolens]
MEEVFPGENAVSKHLGLGVEIQGGSAIDTGRAVWLGDHSLKMVIISVCSIFQMEGRVGVQEASHRSYCNTGFDVSEFNIRTYWKSGLTEDRTYIRTLRSSGFISGLKCGYFR